MSQQDKPREMVEEDKKALGEFITTCFNLNDDIEKFQSAWAQYGFETACDYLRTEKIDKLEAALKIATEALEDIAFRVSTSGEARDGGPCRFAISDDRNQRILTAKNAVERIEEILK